MNEEVFKPNLEKLRGYAGKVKVDYNEYTQYLTLILAEKGKAISFSGIVESQEELDRVLHGMLEISVPTVEAVEDKPKK